MADASAMIKEGIIDIADKLARAGVNIDITDAQLEYISKGMIALVDVITMSSVKQAEAAGKLAADGVTTIDQANAILKAVADGEASK